MPHSDDFLAVHDPASNLPPHLPEGEGGSWWGFGLLLLIGLLWLCCLTWMLSMNRGIGNLERATSNRADRYAGTLESTLERYEFLPALVSLHPYVRDLLAEPGNPARVAAANRYLAEVNTRARASATYVIGMDGQALAASNHGQPGSFVGTDYRFRPYFQRALKGEPARLYAIGVTADEPGYYIAHPVEVNGKVTGVTVVKLNLEWFQQAGSASLEPLLVSDRNGVTFLSSVPAWQYRTLRPLPPALQDELGQTRQYHGHDITPLPVTPLRSPLTRWVGERVLGEQARLWEIDTSGRGQRFLVVSRDVGKTEWTMMVMASIEPVMANARNATVVAALAYACVCLLLVNWRQRRQRMRETQYSRKLLEAAYGELERRVEMRTADLMAINDQLEAEVVERTRAETGLRAAQDELVQASKLAALGQMAAGITHELNQPLAALRTFSDNTRVLLARGQFDAASSNLEAIADLTTRMGKITGQLRLFAGKARPVRHAVSVRDAVERARALIAPRLQGVTLTMTGVDDPALEVWADALKMEQVLLNLLANAVDAIATVQGVDPSASGRQETGRIVVEVETGAATVAIAVSDNGTGISADVLPRLFEPFFTTKELGEGLGLGLAISASIAREFGGQLHAANAPGGGAIFILTLRRVVQTEATPAPQQNPGLPARGGPANRTINR